MPYRRTGRYYRRRSSRPRDIYWSRCKIDGVFAAEPGDKKYHNLMRANDQDSPAVREQIAGGTPELLAIDETNFIPIGYVILRVHLTFQVAGANAVFAGLTVHHNPDLLPDYGMVYPIDMANSADWLAWNCLLPPGAGAVWIPGDTPTYVHQVDARSKRRIKERGESLYLCTQTDAASPTTAYSAAASILLQRSVAR